jgi:hypothetical protein
MSTHPSHRERAKSSRPASAGYDLHGLVRALAVTGPRYNKNHANKSIPATSKVIFSTQPTSSVMELWIPRWG